MPALVKRRVGSLAGTRDEDGTRSWPRSAKKSRNAERTCAAFMPGKLYRIVHAGNVRAPGDAGEGTGGPPRRVSLARDYRSHLGGASRLCVTDTAIRRR